MDVLKMFGYFLTAVFSGVLSSFSQILLKMSAAKRRQPVWKEYINLYVIAGYGIMALCMILTVIAYKGIPFKYGAVLESLAYLYIMILSRVFLKEEITRKKAVGNFMIVTGVILFSLGK
ncbi:MAG: EamA family transporter [Eubacterium sp.]|nr:EamA family transporter [Eubacterium sp.]